MAANPYTKPCKNCSCKSGIQDLLSPEVIGDTMTLYQEWKETGETFQCYLRPGRACCIFWKCLEYIDKNYAKVMLRFK